MGRRDDLVRFQQVGEERREDLADFIRYGDLSASGRKNVRIPIKIVELPEFRYDPRDRGGVGQGEAEPGDPVSGTPTQPGDDGDGDPGDAGGDHSYYDMDPEEFAAELDEALGLELEPKGKKVIERVDGAYTERARAGPDSTLDVKHLFLEGLKRKLSMTIDEQFLEALLRVDGIDPDRAFEWARTEHMLVSHGWLVDTYEHIPSEERSRWPSIEAMETDVERRPLSVRIREDGVGFVPIRREDERYRHPEVVEEHQRNVVVVNIRDVSASMREAKRELVERTFSPLDWYLQGKYDHAEFIYIAHDADAWEVEREDFFGIRSGGGTKISAAYELAAERLTAYPWSEWNRFVFAAGDSENARQDTRDRVIPLMEEIDANCHAYVETTPNGSGGRGRHAETIERHFEDTEDVVISYVHSRDDVLGAIKAVLTPEATS